ncbi:MAG: DUF1684 domain-containing protein [Frankiales bacterium]|nr:DUF1684 domain-containing protein [Frankiales bacterium]
MSLTLVDWRRNYAAIYRDVREAADPASAHEDWIAAREHLFRTHPQSPDPATRLRHAPYDPAWRFVVDVDTRVEPSRLEIPTATDGIVPFELLGQVQLDSVGTLDVWWLGSYGGGIWLPLRDANPDTYDGGRYVIDTVKGVDLGGAVDLRTGAGRLVVDLNFAYNPSCVYDEAWACPLAPPGNRVDVVVPVGELLPG